MVCASDSAPPLPPLACLHCVRLTGFQGVNWLNMMILVTALVYLVLLLNTFLASVQLYCRVRAAFNRYSAQRLPHPLVRRSDGGMITVRHAPTPHDHRVA